MILSHLFQSSGWWVPTAKLSTRHYHGCCGIRSCGTHTTTADTHISESLPLWSQGNNVIRKWRKRWRKKQHCLCMQIDGKVELPIVAYPAMVLLITSHLLPKLLIPDFPWKISRIKNFFHDLVPQKHMYLISNLNLFSFNFQSQGVTIGSLINCWYLQMVIDLTWFCIIQMMEPGWHMKPSQMFLRVSYLHIITSVDLIDHIFKNSIQFD